MLASTVRKSPVAVAVTAALLTISQGTALAYVSPLHTFSVSDVQGGFDGSTFGTNGATQDTNIVCDIEGSTATCPDDNQPFVDRKASHYY